jgi:pimeloyl-ACP methyl ester carboxylesterase
MLHRLLNSLILLPDRYRYQIPADLGLQAEEVTFPNAQGNLLRGLWCCQPRRQSDDAPNDQRPVVLLCPGTSANLSAHLHYVELLCRAGFDVLGFDYTGFGRSDGRASLHSLVSDAICAGAFLQTQKHVRRFGIFGLSIGANVALLAAATRPQPVAGVAVEGLSLHKELIYGLLTTGRMGPRYIETIAYEGQPPSPRPAHILHAWRLHAWLADVFARIGATLFYNRSEDPRAVAQTLDDVPVFFIHGLEDPLLPFEATLEVYRAKPGEKRLWLMPEAGHSQEPVLSHDGEYALQLGDFFHHVLSEPVPAPAGPTSLTWTIKAQSAETAVLRLQNPGPPCLALTTVVSERTAAVYARWVHHDVDVPGVSWTKTSQASCLRLFDVTGAGDDARAHVTERGRCYRADFQPLIRRLSRCLHEGRLKDLAAILQDMPPERPAAPFDFFLGIYCVLIMQRTRYKFPQMARVAAEYFVRYWHYGGQEPWHEATSLWHLAAAVLGQPAPPPACGRPS